MENGITESAAAPSLSLGEVPSRKKSSYLAVALVVFSILMVSVVAAYFWYNRPITPVELSEKETQVLEHKISDIEAEPEYQAGSKEIVFTERELNGLINQNTELGEKLKLTLATGEIHARMESDLDEDLPILGGKKLKARARFLVETVEGRPSIILDDLTVWGASLPNDWLAGMKGKDLITEIWGKDTKLSGVKDIRIERGSLVIRLAE